MTTNTEFPTWTWTDRDGREWTVTETEQRWELPPGKPYEQSGLHTWSIEEAVIEQELYSFKIMPLMHREDVKSAFQAMLDEKNM